MQKYVKTQPLSKCGATRILFEKRHTMDNQNIKPSRWYYGLAIAVFIIGGSLFAVFLFNSLSGLTEALTQVVVPVKSEIIFSETGKYTIFYEYQSVVGNRLYYTGERLSGLHCTLTSKVTGYRIALSRPMTRSTYSFGARKGVSVLQFNIDQPGIYEFSASYPRGQEGPEVVLAMGRGFMKKLMGTIFGGLALFFGSGAIAVAITVVTLLKRQKAKKQLENHYGQNRVYSMG
jgi:hypothetical protein